MSAKKVFNSKFQLGLKNSSESECDKKSTISVYDILDKTECNKNELDGKAGFVELIYMVCRP